VDPMSVNPMSSAPEKSMKPGRTLLPGLRRGKPPGGGRRSAPLPAPRYGDGGGAGSTGDPSCPVRQEGRVTRTHRRTAAATLLATGVLARSARTTDDSAA